MSDDLRNWQLAAVGDLPTSQGIQCALIPHQVVRGRFRGRYLRFHAHSHHSTYHPGLHDLMWDKLEMDPEAEVGPGGVGANLEQGDHVFLLFVHTNRNHYKIPKEMKGALFHMFSLALWGWH